MASLSEHSLSPDHAAERKRKPHEQKVGCNARPRCRRSGPIGAPQGASMLAAPAPTHAAHIKIHEAHSLEWVGTLPLTSDFRLFERSSTTWDPQLILTHATTHIHVSFRYPMALPLDFTRASTSALAQDGRANKPEGGDGDVEELSPYHPKPTGAADNRTR